MTFKYRLEEKVLGPKPKVSNSNANNKDFESAIGNKEVANPLKTNRTGKKVDYLQKLGMKLEPQSMV